jgi:hypothetical protein
VWIGRGRVGFERRRIGLERWVINIVGWRVGWLDIRMAGVEIDQAVGRVPVGLGDGGKGSRAVATDRGLGWMEDSGRRAGIHVVLVSCIVAVMR